MITPKRTHLLRTLFCLYMILFTVPTMALVCEYSVSNDWGDGFTGSITMTNDSTDTLSGWQVSWQQNGSSTVGSAWSAKVSGNNPYTATDMGWNGPLAPASSVSFGFQGAGDDSSGSILSCIAAGESSHSSLSESSSNVSIHLSSSSSSALVSSALSSTLPGSSSASSLFSVSSTSDTEGSCVCNWYGSLHPTCAHSESGWGWENNQSCIGVNTCNNQWGDGGVECEPSSTPTNSSSAAKLSSSSSSSSSISITSSSIAMSSDSSMSSLSSSATPSSSSSESSTNDGLYPDYNTNPVAPDMIGMESDAITMASRITLGWNIGNTMEAIGSETAWGNPEINNQLIQLVKASGFDAIRLPASWDQYADQETAEIDPQWLNRVKDVIEVCLTNDMPVLLNIHWDGGWLENNITADKKEENNAKQRAFWQQIATHLRDFDERLMFAGTNEPNVENTDQMDVLMSYHQTFVDAVRATGGKNAYRILVVQGPSTDIEKTNLLMSQWPEDTVQDRMMAEVHFYTPYQFTLMGEDASWGNQFFYWGEENHSTTDTTHNPTWGEEAFIEELFTSMKNQFVENGIPVVLGEYSAMRRTDQLSGTDLDLHLQSRAYWHRFVTARAIANGLLPFYWDAGGLDNHSSGIFDRNNNRIFDTQTLNALLQGAGLSSGPVNSSSASSNSSASTDGGLYPNYNVNPIAADLTGMESTAVEMASRIKLGWNIGNTMEAIGSETAWGNPMIDNPLIQLVKDSGFDAIRIPASWDQYANQGTAEIDPQWLNRVKDVVEICLSNDMPVILNIHWDGGWLENNITVDKQEENNAKQRAFWQQIATHLRDYDERLMFAGTNEPNVENAEQMDVLMSYHQTFIDAVRETGGKNAYRILVVQGPSTDIEKTHQLMTQLPVDTVPNRMMAEVHFYTPYQFTLMGEDADWGNQFFYWGSNYHSATDTAHNPTWGEEDFINELFVTMKQQFVDNGIPVVLGEYSAMRRTDQLSGENLDLHLQSRAYWHEFVTERALANGLLPFYWDAGGLDNHSSGIFDRENNQVFDTLTLESLQNGAGK